MKHIYMPTFFLLILLAGSGRGLSADTLYTVTDLGTLPGASGSYASGINNAGQVVGFSDILPTHAFVSSNGQIQDLGTLPGGQNSYAYAINNGGQVTGAANPSVGPPVAFLYSNGQMQNLGSLGPCCSTGTAINDRGQITARRTHPTASFMPFFIVMDRCRIWAPCYQQITVSELGSTIRGR